MQSRAFQPAPRRRAQSCAWQQKALWRSWLGTLFKFPFASSYLSNKRLHIGAHISASTHITAEPEAGAGTGWGPSLEARVKRKHLTSRMGQEETMSQHRAKSYCCCWDLTPLPATPCIDPLWCPEGSSQRGELLISWSQYMSHETSAPSQGLSLHSCLESHFSGCYAVKLHK